MLTLNQGRYALNQGCTGRLKRNDEGLHCLYLPVVLNAQWAAPWAVIGIDQADRPWRIGYLSGL